VVAVDDQLLTGDKEESELAPNPGYKWVL